MKAGLLPRVQLLLGIAALMLVLQLGNSLSGYSLNLWGVIPRRLESLPGVLFAPWLHGGWMHLLSNLSGLLVLGLLALLESRRDFIQASLFIILGSGLLVWLFGRQGIHVGASGWLFGLWALLLARAWFRRSWLDLLLAVLVFFLHGGWVFGLLPQQGVSFEYHLAGALCGGLYAAWRYTPRARQGG
ncbi:MAG: rhomboid family intramembrane serine protease [Pseudomonas sp.]|uniref:rhomboid family intramembrane serine protease n=1 Tax=Pseudomonas sp. TaxID=306 RepID=UPI00271F04D4|nr:rhomboid family intramembrane serine protease [Pseudomonas sp.]MDO9617381.1 rhomboid family intramembrane serine protease [Pseudomonas sp.]MDP2446487.1 rhomboid family intramembrane serine protease [Pseudomonas sp.]MDZ4336311.1 rhomboid family intramembrane serine protease [Pseudomonas sp.]